MTTSTASGAERRDVVVLGGGVAGAATAILIRRAHPEARVLIVEASRTFPRKVGESAIEISSWFLTRVLGLDRHMVFQQVPKHGLRFWFMNDRVRGLADASELGNRYQAKVPSWHIDRGILDEAVLGRAREAGVEVWRPARVTRVDLREGAESTVEVEDERGTHIVQARWLVDATGRRALLARQLGLWEPMPEHPIHSIWRRYKNTRDFDGDWMPGPRQGMGTPICSRGFSTNHLTGPGWWLWVIPLPGGDHSVGLVWDERVLDFPFGRDLEERFEAFVRSVPYGRELLEGAEAVPDDLHALRNLPYRVTRYAGDGWAVVGDAGGFFDPLYSMGLDFAAISATWTSRLVCATLCGHDVRAKVERHNRAFATGRRRWFEAIYRDKYLYLGDAELMEVALRMDVAGYYFGIVTPPYRDGTAGLAVNFEPSLSLPFYWMLRFVNRRLARIARQRFALGCFGRANAGRRVYLPGFQLGRSNLKFFPGALARLLKLELVTLGQRAAQALGLSPRASDPPSVPTGLSTSRH
jgi:flavin-dependent dehydrogenase